jgi:hypothetical protein
MEKINELFPVSLADYTGPNPGFDKTGSHSEVRIADERVTLLLVLLQLLDESAEGLETLPKPELSEIVSSAIRLCGFVDPIEARDVSATVLDAIEMQDPISEISDCSTLVPLD